MKKSFTITSIIILLLVGTFFATNALAAPRLITTVWRSFDINGYYFSVLTTDMNSICVLGGVRGQFEGGGEYGYVRIENGAWVFRAHEGTRDIQFWVRCFKYYPY